MQINVMVALHRVSPIFLAVCFCRALLSGRSFARAGHEAADAETSRWITGVDTRLTCQQPTEWNSRQHSTQTGQAFLSPSFYGLVLLVHVVVIIKLDIASRSSCVGCSGPISSSCRRLPALLNTATAAVAANDDYSCDISLKYNSVDGEVD